VLSGRDDDLEPLTSWTLGRRPSSKNLETMILGVTPKLLLAGESEMQQLSEKEASMAISRDEAVRI
jgi:hypothetical protein